MNHYFLLQSLIIFIIMITHISGRTLYYDELNQDDNSKLYSNEDEDLKNLELKFLKAESDYYEHDTHDSYEERKFHERGILSSSRASHTISAHTRQTILDLLQKAVDLGWRPNLKHYIPATRFGRHRR